MFDVNNNVASFQTEITATSSCKQLQKAKRMSSRNIRLAGYKPKGSLPQAATIRDLIGELAANSSFRYEFLVFIRRFVNHRRLIYCNSTHTPIIGKYAWHMFSFITGCFLWKRLFSDVSRLLTDVVCLMLLCNHRVVGV